MLDLVTNSSITASYKNNPACRKKDDGKRNGWSIFISEAEEMMSIFKPLIFLDVPAGSPGTLHSSPRTTQLRRPEQYSVQAQYYDLEHDDYTNNYDLGHCYDCFIEAFGLSTKWILGLCSTLFSIFLRENYSLS